MSTVTRERLAEIKARYTAASDAPWSYDPEDGWIESDGKHGGGIAMMHPHGNINTVLKHNETFSKADAEFITHARTDVPDLVETLEWYIAVAEALGESQERLAKELREARAERDNLAHELKCSNETIEMLYQRSSNFAQQADTHEAEARRLKEIVETYDDRFATLYDEKGKDIKRLQAQVDGNGMLLTAISMVVGDRPGLVEAVQQLKKERDDLALQLEDRADSEYHLRETLNEVNAENQRLKEDLRDIKGAYEYFRSRAAAIYNNTADPEE